MNCYTHSQREATARCAECGNYICHDCAVTVSGGTICKSCAARLASERGRGPMAGARRPVGQGYHGPDEGYRADKEPVRYPRPTRDLNGFFLFCLSAIPGLNYMYLGLMKRGLFFMSTFFLLIFLSAFFNAPFLGLVMVIEMFYSFFDGFKLRRDLICGRVVEDGIDDIEPFFRRNKGTILFGGLFIMGFSSLRQLGRLFERFFHSVFGGHNYWYIYDFASNLLGFLAVVAGFYIIYKAFIRKEPRATRDDGMDEGQNF